MIVNDCADHPADYHQCDRADRNMKRAVGAERQREQAWHDRRAALLLLHDKGVEVDDDKLAAIGEELARERQWGHAAWESGRVFRRRVLAEVIGSEDALAQRAEAEAVLRSLLKELDAIARKYGKTFA